MKCSVRLAVSALCSAAAIAAFLSIPYFAASINTSPSSTLPLATLLTLKDGEPVGGGGVTANRDCKQFGPGAAGRNAQCSKPAQNCIGVVGVQIDGDVITGKSNFVEKSYWDCATVTTSSDCWDGWGWNKTCLTFTYHNGWTMVLGTLKPDCGPGTWVANGSNSFDECW